MTLSKYYPVFLLFLIAEPCLAGPDFSGSSIAPRNPNPTTSSIVVFDLILRNTGNEGGTPVFLDLDWGGAGFLAETEGLDSAEVDHDAGTLSHYLALPAGAEKRVSLHLFTFIEAKGDVQSVRMRLADFNHNSEHWDQAGITLEPRPVPVNMRIGSIGINDAALLLLLWMGGTLIAWIIFGALLKASPGGSKKAAALTFLWMMPIGFWLIFGAMARKDWQILTRWTETRGTIIGRHMEVTTSNTASQQAKRQGTDQNYSITLALRFDHQGKTVFGSGYDPDSYLQIGGRKQREKEIREWTVGSTIPCWYNPDNPTELVVKRGFGGAYFFALLPLPFFLFGVRMLRRR
jgi:hypothetical protein